MTQEEKLPFSLTCVLCDAGNEIKSKTEAERRGWRDITPDPDGLAWNDVGVCPDCAPQWFGNDESKGK